MSEWIARSKQEPSPELKYILVWSKECDSPHIAYYSYDDWNHTECCYEKDRHFSGEPINFKYWQEAPKGPKHEQSHEKRSHRELRKSLFNFISRRTKRIKQIFIEKASCVILEKGADAALDEVIKMFMNESQPEKLINPTPPEENP